MQLGLHVDACRGGRPERASERFQVDACLGRCGYITGPDTDMFRLLNNSIPTYILGDFNGRHSAFGNKDNTTVGKSLLNLINQGKMIHLDPHFPTFFTQNSSINPDKIFSIKHHYSNCTTEPGEITTSDHIPIIFKLSTIPIIIEKRKDI